MKKKNYTVLFCIVLILFLVFGIVYILYMNSCQAKEKPYGVFLGINGDEQEKLDNYSIVIIEPEAFTKEQIADLKKDGKTVYGYLNIGAIENYRSYYNRFQSITLDVYENWPDERWIDVSNENWQKFVVDEIGKTYVEMGFDGLFLDNTDVYYQYPKEEIYQGLCAILRGLKKYDITLMINGGDTFVLRCIEEQIASELFDAVNQETVFTSINFEDETYGMQNGEETVYFKEYLEIAKECGLSVYLLEYGASPKLQKEIEQYCEKNGYLWYNAKTLELR